MITVQGDRKKWNIFLCEHISKTTYPNFTKFSMVVTVSRKNNKVSVWASEHLTVLSLDFVFMYVVNIRCSEISNVLFDRFLGLH